MRRSIAALFALSLSLPCLADDWSCTGTPLPADGGAPLQGLKAFQDALHASDVEGMLHYLAKEKHERSREELTPDLVSMLQMMRSREFRLIKGTSDADRACLEVSFAEMGSILRMIHEDAVWKLADL
jgi:hypothetical protein